MRLIRNISNLLKVKTIVTLAIVFTFCFLTLGQMEISREFMYIAIAVITYYFAKPDKKQETFTYHVEEDRKEIPQWIDLQ